MLQELDSDIKLLCQISVDEALTDDNEEEEETQIPFRKCGWFPTGRTLGMKG